jgi:hypothetical protein
MSYAPDDAPAGAEVRMGLITAIAVAALGAPLGALWAITVPHIAVFHTGTGRGYLLPLAEEDRAAAGGDLVMILVLLIAGLLVGGAVSWACRHYLLGGALALIGGGALGGAIALAVGHVLVRGDYTPVFAHSADNATIFQVRPYVRGSVDLVVLPLAALLVYGAVLLVRAAAKPRGRYVPPAPIPGPRRIRRR